MYKDYGIDKREWNTIKEDVINNELKNKDVINKYRLDSEQVWFLYDKLLQEKYNHLYKREKLVNPKLNDYVYCEYKDFGRGEIISISIDKTIMIIKFNNRELQTMCSAIDMITIHDGVKRKITRL